MEWDDKTQGLVGKDTKRFPNLEQKYGDRHMSQHP